MKSQIYLTVLLGAGLALAGCQREGSAPEKAPSAVSTNWQTFAVRGIVKKFGTDPKTVFIQHENIPNYMAAMTMPFEVKHTNELANIAPGDIVHFTLVDAGTDAWIEKV